MTAAVIPFPGARPNPGSDAAPSPLADSARALVEAANLLINSRANVADLSLEDRAVDTSGLALRAALSALTVSGIARHRAVRFAAIAEALAFELGFTRDAEAREDILTEVAAAAIRLAHAADRGARP